MKKIALLLFVLIFAVAKTQAQNYQIAFAGTGATTVVDSVKVENLTQYTDTSLNGSDILHLTGMVGINELNTYSNNIIRIYPNPSPGICTVGFEATTQGIATFGLYNLTGKRILLMQELLVRGHHTYSLSGINSGIYLLKIESDKYSYSAKIVSSNAHSGIAEIKHIGTTPGIDKQSTVSNTGKIGYLKSGKSVIDMQYTTGDILKLTGFSGGVYRTIFMLIPTQSQTVTFNFVACTDADGNNYPIVQIGTQTWMAENLKTTKYNDNTNIPNVTVNGAWSALSTGAYCWFVNNAATFQNLYGALYNWHAVKNEKLCPVGWHVPSDTEWKQLEIALGMTQIQADSSNRYRGTNQGTQMKNNSGWSNNGNGTNSSGFSALPGGQRNFTGDFMFSREQAVWWSSTEATEIPKAWYRYLSYDHSSVNRGAYYPSVGYSVRCVRDETCGSSLTINHVAGTVAPVNKTVTYGTVSNIPGETSKCWITSNLGSSQQATAVSDATEAPAGWYWQFNRKQGYKHDGTTRTPNTTWITSINENLDWQIANDPCTIELGSGWRIPTSTEWTNVDASGSWTNWNGPWSSALKMHAAGYLDYSNGLLSSRGSNGSFWSSTRGSAANGWNINFTSGYINVSSVNNKAYGVSLRCIKDAGSSTSTPTVTTTAVTGITQTNATSGGNVTSDGGAIVTARGVCWNTSPNPTTANSKTTDGSGTGTFVSSLTGLTLNTPYYVRAYATNSVGTAYGNEVGFTTLSISGFTCGSSITVNHVAGAVAPVAKTVTYGTITNIPGETSKCWITSNLGSSQQATAVNDATEASGGWYWQFNRKQGYKHDGTTRTPNTTWIGSISETSDWVTANDPCTIELGSGWRIPTSTEWTNVDASGGWTDRNGPWTSGLKLHPAGYLRAIDGLLFDRGSFGASWSSTQESNVWGRYLDFTSESYVYRNVKQYGFTMRCLKDAGSSTSTPTVTTTAVTGITQTTATSGGNVTSDGGATVTARGICWNTSPNPTTANSKTTDGSGTGAFVSSLTGLTLNTPYYVRAYASNSVGTTYGNEVSFTTLSGTTCGSSLTINHVVSGGVAPVAKTVTYGTVTDIPGGTSKCWITSNLGASQQATAVNDATETSAGWYWQFNRKQGYKHDGTTRTPNSTWISSINESSDWTTTNDPCTIELGSGWRIPTSSEWTNVYQSDNSWTTMTGPCNSSLKIHAAGGLATSNGLLGSQGSYGAYWSSMQGDAATTGWNLSFCSSYSGMYNTGLKAYGFSLRCIKDAGSSPTTPNVTTTAVTGITQTAAISGGNVASDGGATVTARGVCWSTSPNPTTANSKTTDGSGTGTFVSNFTGLTPGTPYYAKAYATNSVGTAYGNEVNFTTLPVSGFTCGSSVTINHMAGAVAPVAKSVTYGTVTNIPGEPSKCWITSNLGADHQATGKDDATEASAGWYWQFNRKQGYKHDGTTRTPNSTWITPINENLDWQAANDPCTIELGSGWRIPTSTEWTNVDASGNWTDWNGPWNSALKIHAAGDLYSGNGSLYDRGSRGYYWSRSQDSDYGYGRNLNLGSGYSLMDPNYKASGVSLRCLKDAGSANTTPAVTTTAVTGITQTTATSGGNVTSDGGATVTVRGVCWNTSPNPTTANRLTTDGSGTGTFVSNLTGLIPGTPYYAKAYATNSVGTAYGSEVSFTTLTGSTCDSLTIYHVVSGGVAPVDKTITYHTVTNIPGESSKCWITSNLGASRQATAVNDATEAPAGWYWQFNRKQGYKHDGTTRTPNTVWISSISESSDWTAANDPCSIELGNGWRIPTSTEWANVDTIGTWTNWNGPWNSGLKLHAAGYMDHSNGSLTLRGSEGEYWSSTQYSADYGWVLSFISGKSYMNNINDFKSYGFSIRCLKDAEVKRFLVDTVINASQSDVIITVKNKIKMEIPKGTVLSNSRLTIEEEPVSKYPEHEIFKTHFIYNVKIAGQTTFNDTLKITFNYNPANLESGWTKDRLGISYYHDTLKTWISYPDAVVDSALSQITFTSNHLTPLSFTEFLTTGGYQYKFENSDVRIYYMKTGSGKVIDNNTYNGNQSQPWHRTEGSSEFDTPYYIQDLAHWLFESCEAFKNMGFSMPKRKIDVYVHDIGGAFGYTGGMIFTYLNITNDVGVDINNTDFTRSNLLQGTAAHEMLHIVQGQYNNMAHGFTYYRWWLEALATQADRMVWGNNLDHYEAEFYCNKVVDALGNVLYHSLAFSWEEAIDWDWYAAGGFLTYLSNYRGQKFDLVKAIKEGSSALGGYIDAQIRTQLGGVSVGDEYMKYVKWLYENMHQRLKLPITAYNSSFPMMLDGKMTMVDNNKKFSEKNMPHRSTRLIKITNNNIKTDTEFEITVSKPDPAIRIFLYRYQDMKMQVIAELTDKEKRSLTIPEKNINDILIINSSNFTDLPFEVTIAQKVVLPAGTATLGSPQFVPPTINYQTFNNMSTIKSTSILDGAISIEQRGNLDGLVWGTLKITWNQPPGGSYVVVDGALFWKLNLKFEFETSHYIGNPNINIFGLSGTSSGASGGYQDWNNPYEPNFCMELAPDNFSVLAGSATTYSVTKSYNITLKIDCGGAPNGYDGYITFPIKINNYFDEDISVVLKYFYLRD